MSQKGPSKDEALEALDFIVNVLKEHEKDLDRLINELSTITERLGDASEFTGKIEKVEERLTTLQNEIENLITYLSASQEAQIPVKPVYPKKVGEISVGQIRGPTVILRCRQWEDFQNLAYQAQAVSFLYKENEQAFQVNALKSNKIITYSGRVPELVPMLKTWLSKQLEIPEKNILEGILAIS